MEENTDQRNSPPGWRRKGSSPGPLCLSIAIPTQWENATTVTNVRANLSGLPNLCNGILSLHKEPIAICHARRKMPHCDNKAGVGRTKPMPTIRGKSVHSHIRWRSCCQISVRIHYHQRNVPSDVGKSMDTVVKNPKPRTEQVLQTVELSAPASAQSLPHGRLSTTPTTPTRGNMAAQFLGWQLLRYR